MNIKRFISPFRKLFKKDPGSKKVVILSFKFLGDTVFTIPAIDLLKKNYPEYRFLVYCYEENRKIYELYFSDLEYICLDKTQWDLENRTVNAGIIQGINSIRKQNPEILFDLTSNYKTSLISFFSGASLTLGFGNPILDGFYDIFVPVDKSYHQMDMFLKPVLNLNSNEDQLIKEFGNSVKEIKRILINPFAGWSAKQWGFSKFVDLAELLKKEYIVTIIAQSKLINFEQERLARDKEINLELSENIDNLIENVKTHDLIISNDTGIIYIAALLGKYTFTIYGPTNPIYHMPMGKGHAYVQKQIECSPKESEKMCNTFGGRIGCNSFKCMNQLTIDEVYDKIITFIRNKDCLDIK